MCPLFFIPNIKSTKESQRKRKKERTKTYPYALAATFTAEDSGAIEPGDNPPVAFFTQLSDVFRDMFCFFVSRSFDGRREENKRGG